ncbi:hypothetical protein LV457_01690 [Mycobacterium sp. MYCO198283]|uniref:hypothetical protein n=1 Tax=Mycobacterium sp. MYCO198283 TaxID=2883505 RepID=UPI001E57049A|nr:hypothetical protein [Mycobacterium sp. MYCO198283]MCG5431010.1 hypothetical protein [Mycobacterium sp. MYCO198283]
MTEPFLGSEALVAGRVTCHQLRHGCVRMHQDVYLPSGVARTPTVNAQAAWLRSRRRGVLAGWSASALHGARWIDATEPATIIDSNRRPTAGIRVWADSIEPDEITAIGGMAVTTPARTALDLASRLPLHRAVAAVDALLRATHLKPVDVEPLVERYRGRRNIRRVRPVLDLADGGAESPRETWLRLVVIRHRLPRPQTQVLIRNEYGVVIAQADLGWPERAIALEYEGAHHRLDRRQFAKDIRRLEAMTEAGWIVVRITSADTEATVIRRVKAAFARRT